jgi:hypothetical protein
MCGRCDFAPDGVDSDEPCDACYDIDCMASEGWRFLQRLERHEPPSVDESAATLAALKALHPDARNDKRAEIELGLWNAWYGSKTEVDRWQKTVRKYESEIRDAIGEAGVITVGDEVVAYRRIQHVKEHTRKAGTRDMIVRATTKETSNDD